MNGIIHKCSHPDDDTISANVSEKEMMQAMFFYIDRIVHIVKPRQTLFMAVDGIAPRAKMNQQRSRRFRSAQDAAELRRAAEAEGQVFENEDIFDSNCITPGTPFMTRCQEFFKYEKRGDNGGRGVCGVCGGCVWGGASRDEERWSQ